MPTKIANWTYTLLLFCILGFLVFKGREIIMPLAFGLLVSILLLPVNNFLEKNGMTRMMAIITSLTIFSICVAALVYFLAVEISAFRDDMPEIKKQLEKHLLTVQKWIYQQFNLSFREQQEIIDDTTANLKTSGSTVISRTFLSMTGVLLNVTLVPVYAFLFLYYRNMFLHFIRVFFAKTQHENVMLVLSQSRSIVLSYLTGLLIELIIVAVINSAGLLIIGVQYAVFLGVLAAILNMIPYIGMLIAGIFCMLVTLSTSSDISDTLWVGIILTAVQFIDNNIIMPAVVSSKVKINALISILGVLIGGALGGVPGMFLSIPALAVIKAICDRVEELKPWGILLGDQREFPKEPRVYRQLKRIVKSKK